MSHLNLILDTPWKAWYELWRIVYHPFVMLYLKLNGVEVGQGTKWYGFPKIIRHRNSRIIIGDRVEVRSWTYSNPLGVNHPLILTTWKTDAVINIGKDVGITGGIICAAKRIDIGANTLIGANSSIIDTDFHPTKTGNRRYSQSNIKTSPVRIGRNVFIGMNSQILKGVVLGNNCLIGAGSVVFQSFAFNSLLFGNPAKLVKRLTKLIV